MGRAQFLSRIDFMIFLCSNTSQHAAKQWHLKVTEVHKIQESLSAFSQQVPFATDLRTNFHLGGHFARNYKHLRNENGCLIVKTNKQTKNNGVNTSVKCPN